MREVARYKWNEGRYDPTTQKFGDFQKDLKKIAKQAYGDEADKCIKMFLFGKVPVEIQQELTMTNKEDSSPEEIKTYLLRKYQYQNVLQQTTSTYQPFNQMSDNTTKREFTRSDQAHTKLRPNDSRENVSIVGNKGIENKNAVDDNEMRQMVQPSQTPFNQPNDKKRINQNTTQNSFARFADTLGIQLETAENEFPNKVAPHMDNSHTNEPTTRKTKNGDVN